MPSASLTVQFARPSLPQTVPLLESRHRAKHLEYASCRSPVNGERQLDWQLWTLFCLQPSDKNIGSDFQAQIQKDEPENESHKDLQAEDIPYGEVEGIIIIATLTDQCITTGAIWPMESAISMLSSNSHGSCSFIGETLSKQSCWCCCWNSEHNINRSV